MDMDQYLGYGHTIKYDLLFNAGFGGRAEQGTGMWIDAKYLAALAINVNMIPRKIRTKVKD